MVEIPTTPEEEEIEIDEDLYCELMARAALGGLTQEEIVEEALRFFLDLDEDTQDAVLPPIG